MDVVLYTEYVLHIVNKAGRRMSIGSIYSKGGRNMLGRVCVHHRGGGNKRLYRKIDIFRRINQGGSIYKVLKDSFRTSFIGVILYFNGVFSHIILAESNKVGTMIYSGCLSKVPASLFYNVYLVQQAIISFNLKRKKSNIIKDYTTKDYIRGQQLMFSVDNLKYLFGSCFPLSQMPLFSRIYCIETISNKGFNLARAAGTYSLNIAKKSNKIILKMSSGWQIIVGEEAHACFGVSSNAKHRFIRIGKAGKQRSLGVRPTVRGVAKNPCDHPHGGGEGKSSPPAAAVSPWGKLTKGTPTKKKLYHKSLKKKYKEIKK